MKRIKQSLMRVALRCAQRFGFPFGELTISHHSPQSWGAPMPPVHIDLVWRGRRYRGYLVDRL